MKKIFVLAAGRISAACAASMERWKNLWVNNKKKAYVLAGATGGGAVLIITGVLLALCLCGGEQTIYRETEAVRGKLTVGITESGSVTIGTTEQTFDVDISAYTGGSSSSDTGGMGGEGMAQIFRDASDSSSTEETRALKVEEVYVTAGEEVEKGTSILKLTDESVRDIRQELEEDASEAETVYRQLQTGKKQSDQEAEAALALHTLYGTGAQAEYDAAIHTLEASVKDLEEQLAEKEEELKEKTEELKEKNLLLTEQREVLTNAAYSRDSTDRESNLYWWIVAVNTVKDTEELTDTLEEETKSVEEELEQCSAAISSLEIQLSLAEKELASGKITAEKQLAVRQLNNENAQEIYDLTTARSDFETENASKDYEEAKQRLEEFDGIIEEGIISSSCNGLVTEVGISAGDSLKQDGSLLTLNDYEEAQITLEVDEGDMDSAARGSAVNISFTAFPDESFQGEVSEIGDAQIDSNKNSATYSVTVTVKGDTSRLYEGMSASVTFITKESEEVLQISNRAVTREGTVSYVKMKNDRGKIVKKEVVTGFSDGINVEIREGLSEGDTVLIESGVN